MDEYPQSEWKHQSLLDRTDKYEAAAQEIERAQVSADKGDTVGLICLFEEVTRAAPAEVVVRQITGGMVLSWEQDEPKSTVAPFDRRDELPAVYDLKDPAGKVVGAIAFGRDIPKRRRAEEASRVEEVSQESRRDLAINLSRVANLVAAPVAPPGEEIFVEVLETVLDVTRSEWGALGYVAAGTAGRLPGHLMARIGGPRKLFHKSVRPAREQHEGYLGEALRQKKVVFSNQLENVVDGGLPIHRIMVVPLLDRDEAIGYIEIANKAADYDGTDQAFLEGIARSMAPVLRAMMLRGAQERALSAALSTKEVLLQEVHHRVKNNLQVISSLLNLQAQSLPAAVRIALEESQRRIRSMALIHEQLHTNGDVGQLDFAEYARVLCTELSVACGAAPNLVTLRLDLDPVTLDLNEATPCGLILNEIITNSLKHAFPDLRSGTILVSLHCGAGNVVSLRVADDGIGMPPGFQLQESESLGLRIVDILTLQLDGNLYQEPGAGADFTLTFVRRDG